MSTLYAPFRTLGEKVGISGFWFLGGALLLIVAIVCVIVVSIAKKKKKAKTVKKNDNSVSNENEIFSSESTQSAQSEQNAVQANSEQEDLTQQNETLEPSTPVDLNEEQAPLNEKNEESAPEREEKRTATPKKESVKTTRRMLGKWRIVVKGQDAYIAALYASNGEVMLTSEIYSTEEGARVGIETIRRAVENGTFIVYRDKGGDYYYKLKSAGNRLLCVGEIYSTKDACEKAAESVKRIAKDSPIEDGVKEGERFIIYTPQPIVAPTQKQQMGKWKIEQSENGTFSAKLYANNGQIMLSTEEVASRKNAEHAIDAVRKNCEQGNFFIDKDKFGKFYYKLHNSRRSVICTGETYDTIDGVLSAIESVRRFSSNAPLVD